MQVNCNFCNFSLNYEALNGGEPQKIKTILYSVGDSSSFHRLRPMHETVLDSTARIYYHLWTTTIASSLFITSGV